MEPRSVPVFAWHSLVPFLETSQTKMSTQPADGQTLVNQSKGNVNEKKRKIIISHCNIFFYDTINNIHKITFRMLQLMLWDQMYLQSLAVG